MKDNFAATSFTLKSKKKMKTKFQIGDVLQRCDSPVKETFLIIDIVEEKFSKKVWYYGVDKHDRPCNGLVGIVDKCYTKLFNVC